MELEAEHAKIIEETVVDAGEGLKLKGLVPWMCLSFLGIPRRRWLKQGGVWGVHLFELGRELCIIIDLTIFRLTALSD
uniref:Uncharacterized protein n=1 Tax=Cucumis melo TaxID=3656 RepID=A0A9I9ED42_CUCME